MQLHSNTLSKNVFCDHIKLAVHSKANYIHSCQVLSFQVWALVVCLCKL